MEHDISKLTILVLLVLTILVSVLGTWTVMSAISTSKISNDADFTPSSTGHISIEIVEHKDDTAQGEVALNIEK